LIGLVLFFNLQCALVFWIWPGRYAPGFELNGAAGEAAVRGIGILFAMWNIPYLTALIHPVRHRTALVEAVIMQALGAVGETVLLLMLPGGHPILSASIQRFIVFDTGGLVCLLVAMAWVGQKKFSRS
jgi:hypothetical protein